MTSGAVTPDFQRTINVYDSQGGSQPVTFSFVKTGANTWAYEAAYAGTAANISSANPIGTGTVTFNSDGTLKNVNGAAPGLGHLQPDHSVGGRPPAWPPRPSPSIWAPWAAPPASPSSTPPRR